MDPLSAMRRQLALYGDRILGRLVSYLITLLRRANPDHASDVCGAIARRVGPWLPAHRIGRANLRAAFPDKGPAWIETTLRGAWENLGRVAGEYVHMDRIWDFDPERPNTGRIVTDDVPLFVQLLEDGKPALCFAAHLGNWSCRRSPRTPIACIQLSSIACQTTRRSRNRSPRSAAP